MSTKYQEALAAAASDAKRARLAEWDAGLLRGQIGLVQQDLARVRNDLTTATGGPRRSVEGAEREASARSNQQATSLADQSAHQPSGR